MKYKFLYILYILMAICGCTIENDGKIHVDLRESSVFDWDNRIDIVETIPLDAPLNGSYSRFDKCIVSDKSILCYDRKRNIVSVFDVAGKLLYEIKASSTSKQGYFEMKDVIFSHDGKNILILTDSAIVVFDAANGNYFDRIPLKRQAISFYKFADNGEGKYFFWSISKNSIYVKDGKSMYPIRKRSGYPLLSQKFYRDPDGCLNVLSDYEPRYEICTIIGDSIMTKYSFDFGKWNIPEDTDLTKNEEYLSIDPQPYVKCLISASETEEWLFVGAYGPSFKIYFILVDKVSGKISCGFQRKETSVSVIGNDGKYFYGIVYPSSFSGKNIFTDCISGYEVTCRDIPFIIKFKFKFPLPVKPIQC